MHYTIVYNIWYNLLHVAVIHYNEIYMIIYFRIHRENYITSTQHITWVV